ncbi:Methyltransferase-like protein 21D [Geranomyces michiganensis]|nr:Methyltransferase-like protein 21D [Geranomyces michiganensis]
MPAFLRLQLVKAPPATVALAVPFALAISVTDDLATAVYFGTDAIPLRLSLVDATTYNPLDGVQISTVTAKRRLEIPSSGQSLLSVQLVITETRRSTRPKHAKLAVRLVVEVDPAVLAQSTKTGDEQDIVVSPALLGATGVLRTDAGEFLPWPVYSGVVTVSPASANLHADTVQDCQRHFFLPIPTLSDQPHTTKRSESSSSSQPLLRIPVQEHARMTFSTGTHTWDCSPILAHVLAVSRTRWLLTPPLSSSLSSVVDVIELGAGCGLVGTVAALLGAHRVVVTDLDDPSESALGANVAIANSLLADQSTSQRLGGLSSSSSLPRRETSIHARVLEWGKLSAKTVTELLPPVDRTGSGGQQQRRKALIVAADVLYNVGSHDEFLLTLLALTTEARDYDVEVLIGYKKRGQGEDRFFEIARDAGFKIETVAAAWQVEVFWLTKVVPGG